MGKRLECVRKRERAGGRLNGRSAGGREVIEAGQAGANTNGGQVAEWFKAAVRKSCYAMQVASEVRILPLSAELT